MTGAEPYTGQDGLRSGGTYISAIFGTRVATPFFGAGFNVCIGAPAAWRLPAPLKHGHMCVGSMWLAITRLSCTRNHSSLHSGSLVHPAQITHMSKVLAVRAPSRCSHPADEHARNAPQA